MTPFDAKYYFRDDVSIKDNTFDLFLIRSSDREVIRDKQMAYAPHPLPENMSMERARVATIMMQHEIFKRVLAKDFAGIGHIMDAYVNYCVQLVDDNVRRFYTAIVRDHADKEVADRADYWLQYALARDFSKAEHSSYHLTVLEVDGESWIVTAGLSASKPFTGKCIIMANTGMKTYPQENTMVIRPLSTELTFEADHFWYMDRETIANAIRGARK